MQALLEELQVVRGERDRAVGEGKSLKQTITALEQDNQVWRERREEEGREGEKEERGEEEGREGEKEERGEEDEKRGE